MNAIREGLFEVCSSVFLYELLVDNHRWKNADVLEQRHNGCERWIATVCGFTICTLLNPSAMAYKIVFSFGFMKRSRKNLTSCAVSGVPSENFAGRRLNVQVNPSLECFQD